LVQVFFKSIFLCFELDDNQDFLFLPSQADALYTPPVQ